MLISMSFTDLGFFIIEWAFEINWLQNVVKTFGLDLNVDKAILSVMKVSFTACVITQMWLGDRLSTIMLS